MPSRLRPPPGGGGAGWFCWRASFSAASRSCCSCICCCCTTLEPPPAVAPPYPPPASHLVEKKPRCKMLQPDFQTVDLPAACSRRRRRALFGPAAALLAAPPEEGGLLRSSPARPWPAFGTLRGRRAAAAPKSRLSRRPAAPRPCSRESDPPASRPCALQAPPPSAPPPASARGGAAPCYRRQRRRRFGIPCVLGWDFAANISQAVVARAHVWVHQALRGRDKHSGRFLGRRVAAGQAQHAQQVEPGGACKRAPRRAERKRNGDDWKPPAPVGGAGGGLYERRRGFGVVGTRAGGLRGRRGRRVAARPAVTSAGSVVTGGRGTASAGHQAPLFIRGTPGDTINPQKGAWGQIARLWHRQLAYEGLRAGVNCHPSSPRDRRRIAAGLSHAPGGRRHERGKTEQKAMLQPSCAAESVRGAAPKQRGAHKDWGPASSIDREGATAEGGGECDTHPQQDRLRHCELGIGPEAQDAFVADEDCSWKASSTVGHFRVRHE